MKWKSNLKNIDNVDQAPEDSEAEEIDILVT